MSIGSESKLTKEQFEKIRNFENEFEDYFMEIYTEEPSGNKEEPSKGEKELGIKMEGITGVPANEGGGGIADLEMETFKFRVRISSSGFHTEFDQPLKDSVIKIIGEESDYESFNELKAMFTKLVEGRKKLASETELRKPPEPLTPQRNTRSNAQQTTSPKVELEKKRSPN